MRPHLDVVTEDQICGVLTGRESDDVTAEHTQADKWAIRLAWCVIVADESLLVDMERVAGRRLARPVLCFSRFVTVS
jgi:hypothetical protein